MTKLDLKSYDMADDKKSGSFEIKNCVPNYKYVVYFFKNFDLEKQ